jgi:hypothetical protein
MALKRKVSSLESIPESIHDQYAQQEDGTWLLDIDDPDYTTRLDEFRSNNRILKRENEKIQADIKKFDGIDPDKYDDALKALDTVKGLKEKELIDAGKIDEVVESRVKTMRDDFTSQVGARDEAITNLKETNTNLLGKLGKIQRDDVIRRAVDGVGRLRSGAINYVLNAASDIFHLDSDGELKPLNRETNSPLFDSDGKELTPVKWAQGLLEKSSYLFEPSSGGGSEGAKSTTRDGEKTVSKDDKEAFSKNLDDIAIGKVKVVD